MPAPTAAVDICNMALDYLGERATVTSIENPELPSEVILARHYDQTRRSLLEEYIWNFARTQMTIARTGSGEPDYRDKFLQPADCVRLISMGTRGCLIRDYDIQGREILINAAVGVIDQTQNQLFLRYVKDFADVSQFSALFQRVLALQLALNISYKFKNKKTQVELIANLLKIELPKATSVNSQQKKPRRRDVSSTLMARIHYDSVDIVDPDRVYWCNCPCG